MCDVRSVLSGTVLKLINGNLSDPQTNSKDGDLDDKFQSLSLNNNEKKADTPIEEVNVQF